MRWVVGEKVYVRTQILYGTRVSAAGFAQGFRKAENTLVV